MSLSAIQLLHAHGIQLFLDSQSGRLRYRAPAGGLSAEHRDLAAETALEFEERAAILEYDAGMARKDAERLAAVDATGCRDPRQEPSKVFDTWKAGRISRCAAPSRIIARPVVGLSVVDSLRAQIEKLKAQAQIMTVRGLGGDADQLGETTREIIRLEEVVVALQKLQTV